MQNYNRFPTRQNIITTFFEKNADLTPFNGKQGETGGKRAGRGGDKGSGGERRTGGQGEGAHIYINVRARGMPGARNQRSHTRGTGSAGGSAPEAARDGFRIESGDSGEVGKVGHF